MSQLILCCFIDLLIKQFSFVSFCKFTFWRWFLLEGLRVQLSHANVIIFWRILCLSITVFDNSCLVVISEGFTFIFQKTHHHFLCYMRRNYMITMNCRHPMEMIEWKIVKWTVNSVKFGNVIIIEPMPLLGIIYMLFDTISFVFFFR